MGRVAKLKQQARTTARGRRIAMEYDRAARDKRVEVRAAEVRVGDALRRIIAEGVKVGGAAQLCDLTVGVRFAGFGAQPKPVIGPPVGPLSSRCVDRELSLDRLQQSNFGGDLGGQVLPRDRGMVPVQLDGARGGVAPLR